jgi:hypothetical protein
MDKLFAFCAALDKVRARYDVSVVRGDAVMVALMTPGVYVEVEFFADGTVQIERFRSDGVQQAAPAALEEIIDNFRA